MQEAVPVRLRVHFEHWIFPRIDTVALAALIVAQEYLIPLGVRPLEQQQLLVSHRRARSDRYRVELPVCCCCC